MFQESYHLRTVGYRNDFPFVMLSDLCWRMSCPRAGLSVDFLKLTLDLMNSTAEIIRIDADSDETVDMIANGSADISLLSLRQTPERMEKVDFSTPINYLYYGYLIREVPEIQIEDYILAAFDVDVTLLLILFGTVVGCLVFIYSWLLNYDNGSLFSWVETSCIGLIRQFRFHLHRPISALLLVAFWLYFCMIIITYYEAKLKSFLTLSHERGTIFTTLDGVLDAVDKKGWTMVIQERGYDPSMYCNPEQCRRIRRIPEHKIKRITVNDDLNEYVTRPKFVGFAALTYDMNRNAIAILDHNKTLFVKDSIAAPEYLAFAIRKNMTGFRESFNRAIATTTAGYANVRGRYYQPYSGYSFGNFQQVQTLRNSHFVVLYRLCGEMAAGAVLVLIAELIFHYHGPRMVQFAREHLWGFHFKLKLEKLRVRRNIEKHSSDIFPRKSVIVMPLSRNFSNSMGIENKVIL